MIRTRTVALLALLAVTGATAAGCGDDDSGSSDVDPQQVLEETFTNEQSINSANVDFTLQAAVEGDESDSVDLQVTGPIGGSSADDFAAQLNIAGTVTSGGSDESVDVTVTVTEGKGYVEYEGEAYALDQKALDALESQLEGAKGMIGTAGSMAEPGSEGAPSSFEDACEQTLGQFGADTSVCDFTLYDFLTNLSVDGEEDIGGVQATHVSGDIDVEQLVSTIAEIVAQTPAALFIGPDSLSGLAGAVSEAHFNVYSGAEDRLLRGLDLSVTAAVPPEFAPFAGFDSVTEDASLRLTAVNEPVTVEAPANPRPVDELYDELGIKPEDLEDLGVPGLGSPDSGGGDLNFELPGLPPLN
jgi:hypothetical protein